MQIRALVAVDGDREHRRPLGDETMGGGGGNTGSAGDHANVTVEMGRCFHELEATSSRSSVISHQ